MHDMPRRIVDTEAPLYRHPTTNCDYVAIVPKGETVYLLSEHGDWYHAGYGLATGYIHISFLSKLNNKK